jgi:hypothetical protein
MAHRLSFTGEGWLPGPRPKQPEVSTQGLLAQASGGGMMPKVDQNHTSSCTP